GLSSRADSLRRCAGPHRTTLSFPTRRSSDLPERDQRPARRDEPRRAAPAAAPRPPAARSLAPEAQLRPPGDDRPLADLGPLEPLDRKSTRLNSSHVSISYAVFCLKKKIIKQI